MTGRVPLIRAALAALLFASFSLLAAPPERSDARPKKCFGKKINRVVKGSGKTVRLKYRDVAWVAGDRITVIGKPYSVICADRGRQTVRAGKGRSRTSTGADADRIILHKSSNRNIVHSGLGNDTIRGSKGHDFLFASPKKNPRGLPDRDTVHGLGGNDRIKDWSGDGNRLYGDTGSDHVFSLGDSVSTLYGGNGTDFLHSNGGLSPTGRMERLFGERGNDRLKADRAPTNGPAFLDGGSGDDWIYGTEGDDTVIFHSGITKIATNGGDDLIVGTSRGAATIDGGTGRDTMSYAAHTPPGYRGMSGVMVDLQAGTSVGAVRYSLKNIEDVTGSPFDDSLTGSNGVANHLDGGLGNDTLSGRSGDGDTADGGLGQNECQGFRQAVNCGQESPGDNNERQPVVDINEGGVLTVMGSRFDDLISIGYDIATGRYRVSLGSPGVGSGLCTGLADGGRTALCRADINNLNGILVYGNSGDDRITIENSVPASVTTTINGGSGRNVLTGGKSKDYLLTADNTSAGSILNGRGNLDVIYINDDVTARGGAGSDVIHAKDVCVGGRADGGKGSDNVVFAGAARGVDANLYRGTARWTGGTCGNPLRISRNVESLEGSQHADRLTLGRRVGSQERKRSLLGRDGRDVLNARNGVRDTITTGGGGRKNRVIADRKDKVVWGWGLAGY
ncbi:MAG: hypothetical protein M3Y45_00440 [Actinomycetota bacterium]|nr:hypothetical protein [Actinomycetota bacterium]